jgi:hypothetical protein
MTRVFLCIYAAETIVLIGIVVYALIKFNS